MTGDSCRSVDRLLPKPIFLLPIYSSYSPNEVDRNALKDSTRKGVAYFEALEKH